MKKSLRSDGCLDYHDYVQNVVSQSWRFLKLFTNINRLLVEEIDLFIWIFIALKIIYCKCVYIFKGTLYF